MNLDGLITNRTVNLPAMLDAARAQTGRRVTANPCDLANSFAMLWQTTVGSDNPIREWEFCPGRKWRLDLAWPEHRVAVEIDGGVWSKGRHVRPNGFQADLEKHNAAVLLGWRVLRYTADDLRERPMGMVDEVRSLLVRDAETQEG